jgi:hypothetical protein
MTVNADPVVSFVPVHALSGDGLFATTGFIPVER